MVEFPGPADIFAFAVIFFPGYVSLSIARRFHDILPEKIQPVEKIVISFALSVASLALAGVQIDPQAPASSLLSPWNLTLTFLIATLLGVIVAAGYQGWLVGERLITKIAGGIGRKVKVTTVPGTAVKRAMLKFWDERETCYVVVEDIQGRKFRGILAVYSLEPKLQLVLSDIIGKRPQMLAKDGKWNEVEEGTLVFTEDIIRQIGSSEVEKT